MRTLRLAPLVLVSLLSPSACLAGDAAPAPVPAQSPPPGPIGFASSEAYGRKGTTGGAGGAVVTVSDSKAFLEAVAKPGPLVVRVSGRIALPGPMHDVASDKTIEGVGADATLAGGGLNIGGPIDKAATEPPKNAIGNVIVRNLTFEDSPDDSINLQAFAHHVWIDHNKFKPAHDGSLDIKRGSDCVTVSWNVFEKTDKTSLVGHDDGNEAQDKGRLRVTYHHNWFQETTQRGPRVRFSPLVHVFNNRYTNVRGYGIAAAKGSQVLVEGNHFAGTKAPMLCRKYGPGRLVERRNVFESSGAPETDGTVPEAKEFYAYVLDNPLDVPAIVEKGAGPGRMEAKPEAPPAAPAAPEKSPAAPAKDALVPADALDLKAWKLTLPVDAKGAGRPDEVLQPALASFSLEPFFRLAPETGGVAFQAPCGGATTKGSSYPRSELREMSADGSRPAAWSTTEGTHALTITQAITHLPEKKPHVVAGQIHDAEDDVVMIRLEGRRLFVECGGKDVGALDEAYALGAFFTVRLEAGGGKIRIFYNDLAAPKATVEKKAEGCYFKAGCYVQSNPKKGDAPDAFGRVVIRALALSRDSPAGTR